VFAFLGVTNLEIVLAEGLAIQDQREKVMQGALKTVTELRAA
nr:FMN-dependent NADH-azoreductase [Alphaproteobacteria bacterium]